MAEKDSTKIEFANTLRGFAALLVMFGHYSMTFWQYRDVAGGLVNATPLSAEVETPGYLLALNAVDPFVFGLFGVGLFFLISGFVIPFSFQRAEWRGFVVGRVLRIYPTYWAGLTVSVLVILGMGLLYGKNYPYSVGVTALNYVPGLRDLAGAPGIDGVIWTLDIEIKFYVVCALAAGLLRTGRLVTFLIPIVLAIPAIIGGQAMSTYGLTVLFVNFMFIGVAFNFLYRGLLTRRAVLSIAAGLFGVMCAVWWATSTMPKILLLTYGLAILAFSAAFALPWAFRSRRVTDFFAAISYPLYVVHGVMGYAVLRLVAEQVPAWLAIAIASVCSIAVATAIHYLVESPSHQLGRRLSSRFRQEFVAPVAAPSS